MTSTRFLARCAPLAIAMAALPSTPLLAQDAATQTPVIVLDPVPTQQPAPVTITLPETTTPTVTSTTADPAPTVSASESAASQPAVTTARTQRSSVPAARSSRTAETAPLAAAPAASGVTAAAVPESLPVMAASEPVVAPLAAEPAPITDRSNDALTFGLLGALGLAGLGIAFAATRRLRRRSAYVPLIEQPVVRKPVEAAPLLDREPLVTSHDAPLAARDAFEPSRPVEILPTNAAAVALPSSRPATSEEREALLRRMVNAEPDRANPFQSRKARAKRARLIMQSLDRRFVNSKPRFDLSQYTSKWPSLRGWQPATA